MIDQKISVLGVFTLFIASAACAGNVDLPRFPSISPDGSTIVFSWRGDLWKADIEGGQAIRLTVHPSSETRSAWSRDGSRVAFESDRDGYQNLYLMNADGTNVRQVSFTDRSLDLSGFGVDERGEEVLLFDSTLENDVYRDSRPYMISIEGGMIHRLHDAFARTPTSNANGSAIAFTRGGSSWSRRHYRGSDDRDVFVFDRAAGSFRRLTSWEGNDGKAKWGGERTLLFLSDREDDCVNLYRMSAAEGEAVLARLTAFTERDIWDYDVSADGRTAVLLIWDTLYSLDLTDPSAQPLALDINANEDERDNIEMLSIDRRVSEAALSPDEKVMAVITYGEVYVRAVADDKPTRRVTNGHAREKDLAWSPDGLRLYFTSDVDGNDSIYAARVDLTRTEVKAAFDSATNPAPADDDQPDSDSPDDHAGADESQPDVAVDELMERADEGDQEKDEKSEKLAPEFDPARWQDAIRFVIEPVVVAETADRAPRPSPDGKYLSFKRGRGDVVIRDLASGEERTLINGWDQSIDWRWSPDSRYIAYSQDDRNFNSDVWIIAADGSGAAVNVTKHPDNDANPRWSADGKILSFISERINEEYDVWAVYLDKELESLEGEDLEKYYEESAAAAKKRQPLKATGGKPSEEGKEDVQGNSHAKPLDLGDAYLRLRRITSLSGSEMNNEIAPGGERFVFTGDFGGAGLFSVKWDGSDRKRLAGTVSVQHLSLTGDKVVYVSGGQAGTVGMNGVSDSTISISDRIRIDLQKQSSQKFLEAARILDEWFYHPTMKGLDWAALSRAYHQLASQARTADEFNYVAAYFIGELNGSHLGIRASDGGSSNRVSYGHLGVTYDHLGDGYRVTSVLPESPAAKGAMALRQGDIVTAVNFESVQPRTTLEMALRERAGVETVIDIRRPNEDGGEMSLRLLITPVSVNAERSLKYDAWQRENQRRVTEWSDGRIGYLHIRGMNIPSLQEFERDLFAAAEGRDGLIIDVRNNGGGSTADYVLASLMVIPHAYTVPRGSDPTFTQGYPQDRLFIQRYIKPVNMMCNEKSFSNAEIVSHAFKTLRRGTLVGQETYGGVISTGGTTLIDGTFVRLPFRGWFLPDGTDMENNGAKPDIIVEQTPDDESRGEDAQLRAAVNDLIKRLN